MISAFRRYLDTWYIRAFFGLMVLSFITWGVGDMVRMIGTGTWLAKVAGTTIDPPNFDPEYRRALQAATRDLPSGQDVPAALKRSVAEKALNHMIEDAVMNHQLAAMRISVPEATLVAAVHELPAFKGGDGKFDRLRFDSFIRTSGLGEAGFLALLRRDLARQQLLEAVTAGSGVPEAEAAPIYAMVYEKRSADIAPFPIALVPEPPKPDEAAARQWYDEHPGLYGIPEYRRVKAIVLAPGVLSAGMTISDQELRDAYAAHAQEFTSLARRAAEVISAPDEAKAAALAAKWRDGMGWPAMQAAAAEAGASAITQEMATATEYPDPDLARAVFDAPENAVTGPVKGALSWFVIRVTQAQTGGTTPFEEVKGKLKDRLAREKALELIYDRANKIDAALGNGMTLDQLPPDVAAAPMTLIVDRHGDTPEGRQAPIPGDEEIRDALVAAAFDTPKGEPPHLTEVQTPAAGGSGYFALAVEDIQPPGTRPFSAVRETVAEDWRAGQRQRSARAAAQAMLEAVKGGKPFSEAARDAGVTPTLTDPVTRTGAAETMPPAVQQVLFGLKKGEPALVETGDGYLVAVPVEIVTPDSASDPLGYNRVKQALSRTIAQDMAATFEEALRQRANPRINQAVLDQIVQP